ncbi:MAG: hypothetical protein CFH30_00783 [Alphaproteobacteria bacterium MarineAlpha8_Bin1]|nr:MAG: hypothetical protein CFH30_00783 [Alphaproteobacteria bacterium MarineAlpha8_Bin1]
MKKGFLIKFKKISLFFFLAILASFIWWNIFLFDTFPKRYYLKDKFKPSFGVGIVVLTGGKGRIEKGIELLQNGYGEKLFISSVFSQTDIKSKLEKHNYGNYLFECCVSFDNNAKNTNENVLEVERWLDKNKEISKLILVSSYYHLPRAFIVVKKRLPEFEITAVPAINDLDFSSDLAFHIKLIFFEFFKVLYTLLTYL